MPSRIGIAVVGGLVLFAAAIVLLSQPGQDRYVDAGVPAPAFDLPRIPGDGNVSLEEQRGRVVLVNFWATWCKPCEDEMPSMQRLYQAVGGEHFELLAVSVDEPGAPIAEFAERYAITFPILLDPDREVAGRWQALRFPESFLVDGEGTVVERYIGPRTWDAPEYADRIRELVSVLR
jgi:peroxiredoxin